MIGYVLILRRRVCPLSRREATDRTEILRNVLPNPKRKDGLDVQSRAILIVCWCYALVVST